jgi:hypothetical protein
MPPVVTIIFLLLIKIGLAITLFLVWMIYGVGPLAGWHPGVLPVLPEKHFAIDLIGFAVTAACGSYLVYQIAERFDDKIYPMRARLHPNSLFHLPEYELEKLGLEPDGKKKGDA